MYIFSVYTFGPFGGTVCESRFSCGLHYGFITVRTFAVRKKMSFSLHFLAPLFWTLWLPPKAENRDREKERWRDRWREPEGRGGLRWLSFPPGSRLRGAVSLGPPKVLLEHRLFNRREKQCYSCFLHHQVFPTSKYNRDWVIMFWSGIRWIQCFFPSSFSSALFHAEE